MSKVNPIVLIQLIMQYANYTTGPRTFKFTKNNRLRKHVETEEEQSHRQTVLPKHTVNRAVLEVNKRLKESLAGRVGKVYISPEMKKIAIPLQMAASQSGFNVLPTGSRIRIEESKKIRAFTYWEKVNDIDLSCFAMDENGCQEEFSWRSMYDRQCEAITFSGDETSGFHGGSEYFDIDIDKFRRLMPGYRYLVFCDNVYSGTPFSQCVCKAGFMTRDLEDSGEVYEPKTVQTAYAVTGNTTFSYMFAIDLWAREMIWLNIDRSENHRVAGMEDMSWLLPYMKMTETFNVYNLFNWAGTRVNTPEEADIIVSDEPVDAVTFTELLEGKSEKEVIHSYDYEKILKILS